MPESLTTIENSAFWNDSKLYDITLPQNLKYIGGGAFYYCFCSNADMPSDYELVIPDSVNYIGEYAFQGCQGVCHLKLPSGLTKINMGTFYFMNSLREIDIPDGVKTIGFDAFCDCKALSEVKLPAKLEVIGERAFGLCTSLFEVKIPSGVTTINDYAFARSNPGLSNKSLSNLTAVHIPASVTNMGDVFYNDNFDKLVLFVEKDSDAEKYAKTNGIKYSNGDFVPYTTGSNTIYFDTGNGEIICTDGSRFTDYDIPSQIEGVDVVSIAAQAFEGQYYLKNVTIPDRVTEIGKQAFNNCLRLESIVIPNTVTQIGENAFSGILDKDSFVLYVHPDSYAEHYAKDNGFNYEYISEDNNISYAVENGNIYIDENGVIVSADEGITAAEIPTQIGDLNITAIGENAFSNCKALLSVNIPESITAISPSAFAGCDESLVLYMPQNSYAAQFAKDNNLKYAYTDVTFVFGDADADNVVTASDAAFVLQKTLISTFELPIQKKTDDWLKYVDVDDDTYITASDAAFILQKTLISTFELPAEKKDK